MVKVRQKVLDLCKKNKVRFLNAANTDKNSSDYIIKQIRTAPWCWSAARMRPSWAANTPSGKCRSKRRSRISLTAV